MGVDEEEIPLHLKRLALRGLQKHMGLLWSFDSDLMENSFPSCAVEILFPMRCVGFIFEDNVFYAIY